MDKNRFKQIDDARLLSALLENTPDSIYFKDAESRFLRISSSMARRLQLRNPEEALGKTDRDFYASEHAEPALLDELQILRTGQPLLGKEEKECWENGREAWVLTSKMPLRNEAGKISGTLGISWDITERRRAEEALRQEHVESELFINSVPSILIGTNAALEIIRWNLSAVRTFDLPKSSVMGKPLYDCGIKWLDPETKKEMESWLSVQSPRRLDNIPFEKNGDKSFLGITINSVNLKGEDAGGLLITGADTTERKRLEMQLQQAQKMEGIGQLAAGIAHEINTPMQYIGDNVAFLKESWTTICDLTSMLKKIHQESSQAIISDTTITQLNEAINKTDLEFLLAEIPRAIQQSLDGVRCISNIVRAMKEFSHPGTSKKELADINKAIETTVTITRNEWKYVAKMTTCFDTTLCSVPCFIGELNQVIVNLIVNATHAIKEGSPDGKKGSISITTRRVEDFAEISIGDSGAGIPERIRSRIFEPFFTTKGVGKGTGQGLALAHAIIAKKHGGSIWFESEEGKGTTFFLRLPLFTSDVAKQ